MVAKLSGTIESSNDDSLTIRVEGNPGLVNGERVNLEVESVGDDWLKKRQELKALAGCWKNDDELGRIFDEIIEERNTRLPREIEF